MGLIREPLDVDFTVDPRPLTDADRKRISEIIAYYNATGKKMQLPKTQTAIRKGKNISSGKKVK